MSLKRIFLIAAFSFLNIDLCVCACGRAEYEINGECCPMCPPGNRVYRHCTEFTSTTCMPCVGSTYTDEPNGLSSCLSCTVCDVGQGLKVKNACTWTSDTVCKPLEGFYCTDNYSDKCTFALQHTKCNPGEFIKKEGTAVKDTECAGCADGTYSNGSLHICKQHTKCEDLGHEEITPGNNSVDAQCGVKTPTGYIIVGVTAVLAVVLAVGVALFFKQRKKKGRHIDIPAQMTTRSNRFKSGRTSLEDDARSGRPSTVSTPENVETIRQLVQDDHWRTIHMISLPHLLTRFGPKMKIQFKDRRLTALRRSRVNHRSCLTCIKKKTSRSGRNAWSTVLLFKGTFLKGNRVHRLCTEFTSTTCLPCVGSTYTDQPNGLLSCLYCTVCDFGQGLKVKMARRWTSDTVCEPLEGFYCIDDYRDKCIFALQHTQCNPGEYIKQEGTAVKYTECSLCADGTYSNGSFHICKQHTKCKDLGLEVITLGNNSGDAQCGVKKKDGCIITTLAVGLAEGVELMVKERKKKKGPSLRIMVLVDPRLIPENFRDKTGKHTFKSRLNLVMAPTLMRKRVNEESKHADSNPELRITTDSVYARNTFGASCRHGEYLSKAEECCPMCNIGLVVLRDCTGDYSTTCAPCTKGTFMNVPNGVNSCFQCKTCDRGLYILQNCSTIKDTVCEVLDGYYCVQHSDGECSLAMKHSECKPGEQIKTPGNKSSDTVCKACPSGFYSPKGVRCFKWNDCSLNNEIVDEEGTSITDVKCKRLRKRFGLIAAFLISAVPLLLLSSYWMHRGDTNRELRVPTESSQFRLCIINQ